MSVHEKPWADGTPCWADLAVPDLELARQFYGSLLGWQFEIGHEDTGFYTTALIGGRSVAGIGSVPPGAEGMPTAWLTQIATSDIQATVDRATAAGAQVLSGPMPVMEFGTMAVLADPVGATFALWQAATMTGANVVNEPGAMTWNENMSNQFAAAKEFYQAVFGYEYEDMSAPGFEYATFQVDGRPVGGMGGGESNPFWSVCFAVSDTDVTVADAVRLGGAVTYGPEDTPYGRIAGFTGPFGERFYVMSTDEPNSPPAS